MTTAHNETLLGRSEVAFDLTSAQELLRGASVIVTGAGGSIGLQLCQKIIEARPSQLVAVERDEQNLYELDEQMGRTRGDTVILPVLADVSDETRTAVLFRDHRPSIVFHAAAYKHVRYVEENPGQAVVNNILATLNTARMAHETGSKRYVLVSSDKAVQPTSVMGATKRVGEMLITELAQHSTPVFLAVRFGNVIGTRGSAIPKFVNQIRSGGPVTVHPSAERYFMTINEAVGLVLHSTAVGENGQICIQHMGDPVRMPDVVRRLVLMSDQEGEEIDIQSVELQPGEKQRESLVSPIEESETCEVGHLLVCKRKSTTHGLAERLPALAALARSASPDEISLALQEIVPDYIPGRVGQA